MDKHKYIAKKLRTIKDKGEPLEKVAYLSSLSRRTLTNIMNGNKAHQATVDKLYAFFGGPK